MNDEIIAWVKKCVFMKSRLLERQMFRCLFENAPVEEAHRALAAYQNTDGGFGNGIEPDLLVPESSGIGLETAFYYCAMLGGIPPDVGAGATRWLSENVNTDGVVVHPPATLGRYPHQPWWGNPDDNRTLALAADAAALGLAIPEEISMWIDAYAMSLELPRELAEYDYPYFTYAYFHKRFPRREEFLSRFQRDFRDLSDRKAAQFLTLSRYWYQLIDLMPLDLVQSEAARFVASIGDDGMISNPYPELPWWGPIFTLDGLMIIKRLDLL